MADLDIRKIWGVGQVFAEKLEKTGVYKVKDIWSYSLNELKNKYGKAGIKIYYLSRGLDNRTVESQNEIKSISHEETFAENIEDVDKLWAYLFKMSEKVSFRLHSNNLRGNTVFVKVRYADFSTLNRQISLKNNINSTELIYKTGKKLIKDNSLFKKPLRLLGIGLSNLDGSEKKQLNLFDKENTDSEIDKTIDDIKRKYGFDKISRARKLYLKNNNE